MILKFSKPDDRDRFLQMVKMQRVSMLPKLRKLPTRPYLVSQGPSAQDRAWIRDHIRPLGESFDDVQFETMKG